MYDIRIIPPAQRPPGAFVQPDRVSGNEMISKEAEDALCREGRCPVFWNFETDEMQCSRCGYTSDIVNGRKAK